MKITVMKFGGTSVADPEKIARAAERAVLERRKGYAVVAVVSAPGEMTDELLLLSRRLSTRSFPREVDQLLATGEQVSAALFAIACLSRKCPAVSLTGAQAGIKAAGDYGEARIASLDASRIRSELKGGRIVAVAGFQGQTLAGDVATLGRGGSDLTAVALAGALKAESCEIFTDVKGIYTADPRMVSQARRIEAITYAEMLELARAGAQVMQERSLHWARRRGVKIHVRSAFHAQKGTWIVPDSQLRAGSGVRALALGRENGSFRLSAVGSGLGRGLWNEKLPNILRGAGVRARLEFAGDRRLSYFLSEGDTPKALRACHQALGLWRNQ